MRRQVEQRAASAEEETRLANFDQITHNASHHMTWGIDLILVRSSIVPFGNLTKLWHYQFRCETQSHHQSSSLSLLKSS